MVRDRYLSQLRLGEAAELDAHLEHPRPELGLQPGVLRLWALAMEVARHCLLPDVPSGSGLACAEPMSGQGTARQGRESRGEKGLLVAYRR